MPHDAHTQLDKLLHGTTSLTYYNLTVTGYY